MQALRVDLARKEAAGQGARAAVSVDLVAQAGRERLSGSGDFGSATNDARNQVIGVQLTMPLDVGGYRNARQEEAMRRVEQVQAELQRVAREVARQTRAAWLGLQVGASRVAALADALQASRARLDATKLGVEVGDRTTLELLDAENALSTAQLAVTEARVALLMDRLRLASLAGQADDNVLQSIDAELAPLE